MAIRQKKQRKQLFEKAMEAEQSNIQVEYILSELNSYTWRMFKDRIVRFSPSFYKDFGLPEEDISIDKILEYVLEPKRDTFRQMMLRDGFEGEKDIELLLRMPSDGQVRAVSVHIISVAGTEDKDGVKAGFFYFNDEAYKRNEELKQAYRRSEEVAEKESFLASMNDEFRKPVNEIVFYSSLLADHFNDLSDERKTDCEDKVKRANDSLLTLLDSVMGDTLQTRDFEKIIISNVRVGEIMEEIYINSSVHSGGESRIVCCPGRETCEIESNRPVIYQVMNSLISDALKKSNGRITIGWTENSAGETIIFIDNANSDTNQYAKMIASVGGRIDMNYFPGMPARVEIRFTHSETKISDRNY